MRLSAYPRLKLSGITWLGKVPQHWDVKRLKFIFPRLFSGVSVNSDNSPSLDGSAAILKTSCVYGNRFNPEENKRVIETEIDRVACPVTRDSLVISRMNTPELVGNCGYVDRDYEHLFLPDRLWIARFSNNPDANGKFVWYLVISQALSSLTGILATGTSDSMKNLTQEAFLDIRVGVPPILEQATIAAFLDWKTGQIDALISRKQELLEKLKEQRIAVITQAVTQGLDPAVPMRDSGIHWLGKVPQHWEVRRLKFTASESLQYGANEAAELDDPDCPRYIRITDIKKDGTLHEDTFRSIPPEVAEPYLLEDGDLLLARSGATVGKSFQYLQTWGQAAYAGYLIRFRVDRTVLLARFAYYFLRSQFYWGCIDADLIQATIQNFSAEKYAAISVPLPPLYEQETIIAELDKQKLKIDKLEEATSQAIDRLAEYRTALITAATTGKIDVRKVMVSRPGS